MKQALLIMQLALGIVPQMFATIQAIEVPGHGAEKLNVITQLVQAGFDTLPGDVRTQIEGSKIVNFATRVTGIIVSFLNLTGVFTTKSATQTPAITPAK